MSKLMPEGMSDTVGENDTNVDDDVEASTDK